TWVGRPSPRRRRGSAASAPRRRRPASRRAAPAACPSAHRRPTPAPMGRRAGAGAAAGARERCRRSLALGLAADRHGEQLKAMTDELVTERLRHVPLQLLDILIAELDDPPALNVDQVVVMVRGRLLVARAPVAEIVAGQDVRLLEKADGA